VVLESLSNSPSLQRPSIIWLATDDIFKKLLISWLLGWSGSKLWDLMGVTRQRYTIG